MCPWYGKDSDAQTIWRSQDQIPAARPLPWQQRLTGTRSQRQQPLLKLNQKAHPGRDEQLSSSVRDRNNLANTNHLGQESRTFASKYLTQFHTPVTA